MTASAPWRGATVPGGPLAYPARQRLHGAVSPCRRRGDEIARHSFLLDGEAIVTNDRGLTVFDLIRYQRHGGDAMLITFDLIELEGEDLAKLTLELERTRDPDEIARRSGTISRLLRRVDVRPGAPRPPSPREMYIRQLRQLDQGFGR
jgi:hypothetical protein